MYSFSVVAVVLLATSYALAEEHLVSKHGLESRHSVAKRDLSESDMEMILKALLSKMEHKGMSDSELVLKKSDVDRGHYLHGAEAEEKLHHASKDHTVDYAYKAGAIPHGESGYDVEKSIGVGEKDIAALMMKMKELGIGKDAEESYRKEVHLGSPEEKFLAEKDYYARGQQTAGKTFEAVMADKFSDKDVSLAESMYHMKIAADVETYPHIKMAPLYDLKMADEKLRLEKPNADESYLKKIDEISKTILKEEHLKDGEAFLKKISDEKSSSYGPKIAHSEGALKSEEKALKEWITNHKDLFLAEDRTLFDDKLIKEGIHHADEGISFEITDELIKKLKSLGLDKEHDELLHLLSKEMHKEAGVSEGSIAFEKAKEQAFKDAHIHLSEEEMKKHIEEALAFEEKGKLHGSELLFEKGLSSEKVHGLDKSLHGIMGEEAFKAKEAHALDEAHKFEMDKTKFIGKIPFMEGEAKHGIAHEMSDKFAADAGKAFKIHEEEIMKKEKGFATDGMLHKTHEEELLKKGLAHGTESMLHKAHEEELFKKGLGHGTDTMIHKAHEEEMFKKEIVHGTEPFLHKTFEEDLLKKEKIHGADAFLHKSFEEGLLKNDKAYGTDAFLHKTHEDELRKEEKAFEIESGIHKAHEDELIKKEIAYGVDSAFHKAHEDELKKKEFAYGVDSAFHKAHEEELLNKGKAHGIDSGIHKVHEDELIKKEFAYGVDSAYHKAHEDELKKKEFAYGVDSAFHKAHEDELKKKEFAYGVDPASHKAHEYELTKKEIAYGIDSAFHKAHEDELKKKEFAYGVDSSFHKAHEDELKNKEFAYGIGPAIHKAHEDELIKKEIATEAGDHIHEEKTHTSFHDLKTKFFELLRKVFRTRKCHLVTMGPRELIGIVNCVSRSKDPLLCEKFAMCEKKKPARVIAALEKCQQETIPGQAKKCTTHAPLFPSVETPLRIFQCVAIKVRELIPEEQKIMIEFEECAREVKAESCARTRFFPF